MVEMGFRDPLLLTTLPNAVDYLGAFAEKAAVYYCVDDFTLWPGVNRRLVADMEARLLKRINLLVCSSQELANIKQCEGLRTEIIPHGVDIEHFARAGAPPREPIPVLTGIRKPTIGYFGLLGEWVDLALLEKIVRRHPEWTLVLMGTVVADTTRLAAYPNVLFTGPIPYERLPDHVAYLDTLILPYLTEGRGHSITPLKLREYIATGKPVVSTSIPECCLYQDVISIAASHDEFDAELERAVVEGDVRMRERREAVKGDDWSSRAEMLSAFIERILMDGRR
jgi:glycosyltransferase involved in cell wall biosynthesis